MKLSLHKIISLLFVVLLLISCQSELRSDKVEQRIIFPSYIIDYDAAQQLLEAKTTFQCNNESGEYVRLSKKSFIRFNDEKMKWKSGSYFLKKEGDKSLLDSLVFQYRNDEEDTFINRFFMKSIEFADCTLRKGEDNYLRFFGKKMEEEEMATLVLTSGDLRYELLLEATGSNTLLLESSNLGDVAKGSYSGQLQRTLYSTAVNAMDRGGCVETNYHSEIHKVIIQ